MNELKGFNVRFAIDQMPLGNITDSGITSLWGVIEYSNYPTAGLLQSEEQAEKRCFARSVGPDDRNELPAIKCEVRVSPDSFAWIPGY